MAHRRSAGPYMDSRLRGNDGGDGSGSRANRHSRLHGNEAGGAPGGAVRAVIPAKAIHSREEGRPIPDRSPAGYGAGQSGAQVRKPAKMSRRSGPKKFRYSPVTMRDRVVHAPPRSTRVWPNSVCEYSL